MNKKVISLILIALATYIVSVILVVNFYDDSPSNMQWEDREAYNQQFIARLQLNEFTFEQALAQLDSPDITEAKVIDDKKHQVMFYRTQHIKSDGFTTQEECTFLLFINGQLKEIGLGSNYTRGW